MIIQIGVLVIKILRVMLDLYWRIVVKSTLMLRGIEGVNLLLLKVLPNSAIRILRLGNAAVGQQVSIFAPLLIVNASQDYSNLSIGNRVHIGKDVLIDLHQRVTIEDRVTISMGTRIITHQHVGQSPLREMGYPYYSKPVVIEHGAYIGTNVVILQGIRVGECSVIGAGAIVNKDIPPYSVAMGIPARVIKVIEPSSVVRPIEAPHYQGKYAEVQRVFDEVYETGQDYASDWASPKMRSIFESTILASLNDVSSEMRSILEVGCGNGRWLALLRNRLESATQLTGIDLSPQLVAKAHDILREKAQILCGNFIELSLEPNILFDAIYFYDVFQHFSHADYHSALRKAASLIKPDGLLMILDKEAASIYAFTMRLKQAARMTPLHYSNVNYPSFAELIKLAESVGWKVQTRKRLQEYHYLALRKLPNA
ncbi:MAG: methyltransferase domain-containing protein [Chloroflexota bacterium]